LSYSTLARVYDSFAYDFDYDAWTAWYEGLIKLNNPAAKEICDCGCGTGSISVRLARKGYRLTGIDLSEDMLLEAQKKARLAGVRIPFIRQDMRKLTMGHPVDAVICACDGVNYLLTEADVKAFLRSAATSLKPSGVLAFDISNMAKLNDNGLYAEDMDNQSYIWKNEYDTEKQLLTMRLSLFIRQKDGSYKKHTEEHIQKAHTVDKITGLLSQSGFGSIRVYGSDEGETEGPGGKRVYFTAVKE